MKHTKLGHNDELLIKPAGVLLGLEVGLFTMKRSWPSDFGLRIYFQQAIRGVLTSVDFHNE